MDNQYTKDELYKMYPPIDWERLGTALAACLLILTFAVIVL